MFYFILIYYFIIYLLSEKKYLKYDFFHYVLLSFPMVFIILFRFGYGADYLSYELIYKQIDTQDLREFLSYNSRIDVGYKLIMLPFVILEIPFHIFFVTVNLFIFVIIYLWIKESTSNLTLSIILFYVMFFFVWVLSSVRQGIVLALILYFIMSKKNLKILHQILLIAILSVFHKSVLIVYLYMFLDLFKWTKKKHLFFLGFGILANLIPFAEILSYFDNIKTIWWLLQLYNSPIQIFSFSVFMRIFFFFVVYIFYDKLIMNYRKNTDYFLIGISLFFVFGFSELTAARLTIYSFIIVVILIPELIRIILDSYDMKYINKIVTIGLFLYISVFYLKELSALRSESKLIVDSNYVPFITIFEKDYNKFDSKFSFILRQYEGWSSEYYKMGEIERSTVDYDNSNDYTVINYDNKYGVMDNDGNWLIPLDSTYELEVIDDILITKVTKNIFSMYSYVSLSGEEASENELRKRVLQSTSRNDYSTGSDELMIHFDRFDLETLSIPTTFFPNVEDLQYTKMSRIRFKDDKYYYILELSYKGEVGYIYFNEYYEMIFDNLVISPVKFDDNGFADITTHYGTFKAHIDGNIISYNEDE